MPIRFFMWFMVWDRLPWFSFKLKAILFKILRQGIINGEFLRPPIDLFLFFSLEQPPWVSTTYHDNSLIWVAGHSRLPAAFYRMKIDPFSSEIWLKRFKGSIGMWSKGSGALIREFTLFLPAARISKFNGLFATFGLNHMKKSIMGVHTKCQSFFSYDTNF